MPIFTIGHSNRTFDELVALLQEHAIAVLADVRRYPGSRRHPQFSRDALRRSLPLEYRHFEDLGGHREPSYSDWMTRPPFAVAIDRLLAIEARTAIMCAEALPANCHRNLLSDELVRRGVAVVHILGPGRTAPHASAQKSLDFRAL